MEEDSMTGLADGAEPLWRGVGVALVTLFHEDRSVDVEATAEHAARLVGLGVRAVLVAGTTGETDALTDAERVDLVVAVRQACPGVPVLAGASGAWAAPAVQRCVAAAKAGADAVLVAPPRRVGDLREYYDAVATAGIAVLAYHFPGIAGGEVPVDALPALPVAGIKDSTGDAERLLRTVEGFSGWTYVGSSSLVSLAGQLGATGAILAVANAVPEDCVAAFGGGGDGSAQRRLTGPSQAARDRFPYALKELVARRFGTATACRLG
jgi:4-hydroxy-tetrahydrodipicolinate synthase